MAKTVNFSYIVLVISFVRAAQAKTVVCEGFDGYLNVENIAMFAGCTMVHGSITINESSFQWSGDIPPLNFSQLTPLRSIRRITGYLNVHDVTYPAITNLKFLSNLRVIDGNQTVDAWFKQHFALVVSNVLFLETLNLVSLQEVTQAGIKIVNNKKLCLADTIDFRQFVQETESAKVGGNNINCSVSCSQQCNSTLGCWGTESDQCRGCRNYQMMDSCVQQCDSNNTYANDTELTCQPCHAHCIGCSGWGMALGAGACTSCKFVITIDSSGNQVCGPQTGPASSIIASTTSSTAASLHSNTLPSNSATNMLGASVSGAMQMSPTVSDLIPPNNTDTDKKFLPILVSVVPVLLVGVILSLLVVVVALLCKKSHHFKLKGQPLSPSDDHRSMYSESRELLEPTRQAQRDAMPSLENQDNNDGTTSPMATPRAFHVTLGMLAHESTYLHSSSMALDHKATPTVQHSQPHGHRTLSPAPLHTYMTVPKHSTSSMASRRGSNSPSHHSISSGRSSQTTSTTYSTSMQPGLRAAPHRPMSHMLT